MGTNVFISKYKTGIYEFYKWRNETGFHYKLLMAFMFACLTGLGASIRVYTPFSPVPFTGQVLFVLLSGVVLGSVYGGLSQTIYLSLGMIGVPWFAGGNNGFEYVFGATGGYLIGFVVASTLIGWYSDRYTQTRTMKGMLLLMMIGLFVIYSLGVIWLVVFLQISLWNAIIIGAIPFITIDIIKALLAAGAGRLITTRELSIDH